MKHGCAARCHRCNMRRALPRSWSSYVRTPRCRACGRELRVDLAAAYRLVAAYGWSDLVFTHISARVSGAAGEHTGEFLINPYGFMFE